jgi:serine/threonine-protein kinase HipA
MPSVQIMNQENDNSHASSQLLPEGPMLALFIDLLSTKGLAEGLAMRIGGEGNPAAIRKRHWELSIN